MLTAPGVGIAIPTSSVSLFSQILALAKHTLIHWGRVTHVCVGKLTTIGSDNGLSPGRRQAIIWTNDGILLIWTLGTNCSDILSEINSFSFKKTHLKMSSAKWRLSRLGLNELTIKYHVHIWQVWLKLGCGHTWQICMWFIASGARLTKAYDVTIQRYRNSHAKIEDSKIHILRCMGSKFCVKFQRCPLIFHTKLWTHTPQNMHLTGC